MENILELNSLSFVENEYKRLYNIFYKNFNWNSAIQLKAFITKEEYLLNCIEMVDEKLKTTYYIELISMYYDLLKEK